jgi:hypothetical protein
MVIGYFFFFLAAFFFVAIRGFTSFQTRERAEAIPTPSLY